MFASNIYLNCKKWHLVEFLEYFIHFLPMLPRLLVHLNLFRSRVTILQALWCQRRHFQC